MTQSAHGCAFTARRTIEGGRAFFLPQSREAAALEFTRKQGTWRPSGLRCLPLSCSAPKGFGTLYSGVTLARRVASRQHRTEFRARVYSPGDYLCRDAGLVRTASDDRSSSSRIPRKAPDLELVPGVESRRLIEADSPDVSLADLEELSDVGIRCRDLRILIALSVRPDCRRPDAVCLVRARDRLPGAIPAVTLMTRACGWS